MSDHLPILIAMTSNQRCDVSNSASPGLKAYALPQYAAYLDPVFLLYISYIEVTLGLIKLGEISNHIHG